MGLSVFQTAQQTLLTFAEQCGFPLDDKTKIGVALAQPDARGIRPILSSISLGVPKNRATGQETRLEISFSKQFNAGGRNPCQVERLTVTHSRPGKGCNLEARLVFGFNTESQTGWFSGVDAIQVSPTGERNPLVGRPKERCLESFHLPHPALSFTLGSRFNPLTGQTNDATSGEPAPERIAGAATAAASTAPSTSASGVDPQQAIPQA